MTTLSGTAHAEGTGTIDPGAIEELQSQVRGPVLQPGEEGYDEARTIWNAMIDKRPALIVQSSGVADVMSAVAFARDHAIPLAIHGGGHNIAGNAVVNDGLMLDLSQMKSVRVDPAALTVHVGPGATLGDLDHETQAFGLAVPTGINSTTGVAGLALGGGVGWLTRKYGLTVDSLISADVVTADAQLVRASADENPDLFWALRGGGGNFGVVTSFVFQLHPVGPEVLAGLIVFPLAQAKSVLTKYREYAKEIPEDLTIWVVMRKAPPLPFLPEEVHGKEVVVMAACYAGALEDGQKLFDPIRQFGTPLGEHVGVQPFTAWQTAFDPLLTPGARNYWKSHNFTELSDGLFDALIEFTDKLPSPHCEVFIGAHGGYAFRIPVEATAYAERDAQFILNIHGRWETPEEDAAVIAWARALFDAAGQFATGSVYVNFMTEDESDRVGSAYGPNLQRLIEVKTKYDPTNLFRINHNIKPTA